MPLTTWPAPGTPIAAWSGPSGSSLIVYLGLPAPGMEAKAMATGLANRLENLPELKLLSTGVVTVSGLEAGQVVVAAPGTGASLAPTGVGKPVLPAGQTAVATRRVSILIPRATDTVGLLWHAPETSGDWLDGTIATTLKSMTVTQDRLSTSSY